MTRDTSAIRKKSNVFATLFRNAMAAILRRDVLLLFAAAVFICSFASRELLMNPITGILYDLGGTVPGRRDYFLVSQQMIPVLAVLLANGRNLSNELNFRCQIVLPKCQSRSIWFLSLLTGSAGASFVFSLIGIGIAALGGFLFQKIFNGLGWIRPAFRVSLTEYLNSDMTLETFSNVCLVFVLVCIRLMTVMTIQLDVWLISAKESLSLFVAATALGVTLMYPQYAFLPVGGTMFFGITTTGSTLRSGIFISLTFVVLTSVIGWIYSVKTDWIRKFNH